MTVMIMQLLQVNAYVVNAIRRSPDTQTESTARSSNIYNSVADEKDVPAEEKTTDCLYEGEWWEHDWHFLSGVAKFSIVNDDRWFVLWKPNYAAYLWESLQWMGTADSVCRNLIIQVNQIGHQPRFIGWKLNFHISWNHAQSSMR